MVKLAEFDLCTSKNTRGRDYKGATNANPVNDIQTKIIAPTEQDKYLSETER